MSIYTRPIGLKDANYIVNQNSYLDLTFRGEYDASNNLIYKGLARVGAPEGDLVWQIAQLNYDGDNNLTSILWPVNSDNRPSVGYEFSWTARATYTYA